MILTPVASRSPAAVRDALVRRGMDATRADAAARGLVPVALLLDGLSRDDTEQVSRAAHAGGVECLTGDGWVLLAAAAARLAGLARPASGALPPALAPELGRALQAVVEPVAYWTMAHGRIALDRPIVVGILNVTPDSFSDGGSYLDPEAALRHAATLIEDGAHLIDVGAESTRPGRPTPVSAVEEWQRLESVLTGLVSRFPHTPLSVDTVKAEIARRALDAGAWAINDVSGLRLDPAIADACAAAQAGLVLMHSRGTTRDMATYDHAVYADVSAEVRCELQEAAQVAEARGLSRDRLVLDPGLGFAKAPEQNYEVLRHLPALTSLGYPVMIGPSRKRFLGAATQKPPDQRDSATAAACVAGWLLGAGLFRVHNVAAARDALAVANVIGTG